MRVELLRDRRGHGEEAGGHRVLEPPRGGDRKGSSTCAKARIRLSRAPQLRVLSASSPAA